MADVTPEMVEAKARAEARLLAMPGVTGVDIGFKEVGGEPTDQLAIRVLVREKKPIDDVPGDERIPAEIDGHPSDVIARRFELHSVGAYAAADDVPPPVDAGTYNPLKGGVSAGPCRAIGGFVHAGTLGAIVVDNATKRPFALSNFHVLAVDENAADGDTIVQPSRIEGGSCPAQIVGRLRRHALTGAVDGAVLDLVDTLTARPEVAEIGELTGIGTATLGQPVRKRGRTTRLTYGIVDSVNLSLNIDYGHGIGVKTLTGQIGVRPDTGKSALFSAKGDSGAVIVGDAREVIGLLFAGDETGYAAANPIAEVLAALDISIATAPTGKRVELFDKRKEFPEFKDRFTKERKSDKTEFKEDKDLKNEDKELKDRKDETKDSKDEGKELKDKQEKNERKESKDKQEKPEFKNEGKEDKDSKDEGKEKDEKDQKNERKEGKDSKDEAKEWKDERKEFKDEFKDRKGEPKEGKDEFKDQKNEPKETKDEFKDLKNEGKENKDDKEKQEKDFQFERFPVIGQDPVEQRIAALEAAVAQLSSAAGTQQPTGDERPEIPAKDLKSEKPEKWEIIEKPEKQLLKPEKDKLEKPEGKHENKEFKLEKPEHKQENKEFKREKFETKENKLEGKDIKSEKPENKDFIPDKPVKEFPEKPPKENFERPIDPIDPIDRRLQSLETTVTQLSHFILRSMRPDLSQGALHREPDQQDKGDSPSGSQS